MHKYSFRVFWSDGDNGFVAVCPELPGVSAIGATEDEAIREAKIAQELYIEDMLERGEQLPEPQTAYEYSGQTRLRMSKALHRTAAELADGQGVSLNQFINDAVAARVGAENLYERIAARLDRRISDIERRTVGVTEGIWHRALTAAVEAKPTGAGVSSPFYGLHVEVKQYGGS
jgi:antitoxin HicB